MAKQLADLKAFLAEMHQEDLIDLRGFRPGHENVLGTALAGDAEGVQAFIEENPEVNIYFGVASRDGSGRGRESCTWLRALFVEFDFKDTPEAEVRARLAAFPLSPGITNHSGGGLHCYWPIDPPLDLRNGGAAKADELLKAFCERLGGDRKSAEVARILRPPGTLNYKYDPPRPVTLESLNPAFRYQLDHVAEVLAGELAAAKHQPARPTAPVQHGMTKDERAKQASTWLACQQPAVQGSGGDAKTYEVCCSVIVGHDLDVQTAMAVLKKWNATCQPPWSDRELADKVRHADRSAGEQRGGKLVLHGNESWTIEETWLSTITPRPVKWLWNDWLSLGSLSLLGGREGIGKSTLAFQLAADITRGTLPGEYYGKPRVVYIVTVEDSLDSVVMPRMAAAGADLTRVGGIKIRKGEARKVINLPEDLDTLERHINERGDVGLIILDPLMSRLDGKLNTHKDAEVRRALEPLATLAEATKASVLGIIHVNKSTSNDALNTLMGSRAFSAVARQILYVMKDPRNEGQRLLGLPKNNYGRTDLPTKVFTLEEKLVCQTDEGPVTAVALRWAGDTDRTIKEAMEETIAGVGAKSPVREAADWLEEFMKSQKCGWAWSIDIKNAGRKEGLSESTLKRAKARLQIETHNIGYPKRTAWALKGVVIPEQQAFPEGEEGEI